MWSVLVNVCVVAMEECILWLLLAGVGFMSVSYIRVIDSALTSLPHNLAEKCQPQI